MFQLKENEPTHAITVTPTIAATPCISCQSCIKTLFKENPLPFFKLPPIYFQKVFFGQSMPYTSNSNVFTAKSYFNQHITAFFILSLYLLIELQTSLQFWQKEQERKKLIPSLLLLQSTTTTHPQPHIKDQFNMCLSSFFAQLCYSNWLVSGQNPQKLNLWHKTNNGTKQNRPALWSGPGWTNRKSNPVSKYKHKYNNKYQVRVGAIGQHLTTRKSKIPRYHQLELLAWWGSVPRWKHQQQRIRISHKLVWFGLKLMLMEAFFLWTACGCDCWIWCHRRKLPPPCSPPPPTSDPK